MIILGYFFLVLYKNACGFSLEVPCRGPSNEFPQHVLNEKQENVSKNYY